jgi:GalNAc-alpha-(1->4)-GalNAc-alpha-(1->3)-diNAcBac-PP-undecaprenol alpha-1,4-N-acetyl-D-galactosaminyltransferase
MRISLVISSLSAGGAEKVMSELANYLDDIGYNVSLITLDNPNNKPFYPLNKTINLIQVNQISEGNNIILRICKLLKRILVLRKTLKKTKPDIIISFMDVINVTTLISSINLKTPVVVSERIDPNFHLIPFLYKKLRLFLYPKAQKVIVQTKSSAEYFSLKTQKLIQIIPNPVKKFNEEKIFKSEIIKIISLGRLDFQKDHKTLIKAFSFVSKQYPKLQLFIYGQGSEKNNLENLIKFLKLEEKVFLKGVTSDVESALLEGDIFVFPSMYEGFPNALCEAMSLGLPVIASNCSGNIDIIKDHFNGRIFPIGNVEVLANLMIEIIEDSQQRKTIAENAKKISDELNADKILKVWKYLIESLITQK